MTTTVNNLVETANSAAPKEKTEKIRIEFLDGLRGFAALYVVIYHGLRILDTVVGPSNDNNLLAKFYYYLFFVFKFGTFAVVVFLVISGYSLMLPIARSLDGTFSKGVANYFMRRFRRILPPYYIALSLSLLLIAFVPNMNSLDTKYVYLGLNNALPALKPDVILSHVFMVHDLNPDWSYKINGPMWSIPIEFQLYFLFPFIFLPIWRKFGSLVTAGIFLVVGLVLAYSFKPILDYASPWFIALFVFGMAGASINFSRKPIDVFLRNRVPWGLATIILAVVELGVIVFGRRNDYFDFEPLRELIVGLAALCGIVYLTEKTRKSPSPVSKNYALRILNNKWVLLLGSFSYSLYLIHNPVQNLFAKWSVTAGLSEPLTLTIQMFVVIPLVLVLAYGFHILFERRFMNSPRKN